MGSTTDPRQRGETGADAPPPPANAPPPPPPELDPENKKALREAIHGILRGIPFIGPYIVIVKLKWGWSGILLLIGGFLIATVLTFTGLLPESAVSDRYKRPDEAPAAAGGANYEVKRQQDVLWDAVVNNARGRIWASGVALTRLNPQLLTQKVKEGVATQVVYVNPCGEMIKRRQADENNPNSAENIRGSLRKFDNYARGLTRAQRDLLHVKLTDAYPTMVVAIVDDDLYAYFCPYGAVCSDSPVLVFKSYRGQKPQNDAAQFFESHFNAISEKATRVTDYLEPCPPPAP